LTEVAAALTRPRSHRTAVRVAAVATLTAIFGLLGTTAASAAYTPDGEATLTVLPQYYAEQSQDIVGYCQDDTVSVDLVSDTAGVTIDPFVYNADPGDPGAVRTYYTTDESLVVPGSMVVFILECRDAADAVLGTTTDWILTYDPANDTVAPSSVVVGEQITVSGVCPDDQGSAEISAWVDGTNAMIVDDVAVASTPAWSSTFSSVTTIVGETPAVGGDVIRVAVSCVGVEDDLLTVRQSLIDVVTAPAVDPADPAADPGDELAATGAGIDTTVGIGALALLVLGVALVRRPRRFGRSR
jgi:hypothetical protein